MNKEYIRLCSIPAVQEKIRERMGGPIPGDWLLSKEGKPVLVVTCSNNTGLIRLPQVHDWQNPERGLWGMVDWKKYAGDIQDNGEISIIEIDGDFSIRAAPELALLRACMHQWEIEEVKG